VADQPVSLPHNCRHLEPASAHHHGGTPPIWVGRAKTVKFRG
jgi:hypothetical protein